MSTDAEVTARRQVVLAMLSSTQQPDAAAMARFGEDDWQAVAEMVSQHRVASFLHAQMRARGKDWPVPAELQAAFAKRHAHAAVRALKIQATLRKVSGVLNGLGLPYAVLKGGWLAFHLYPQPAQRPMGDIDVLVPADGALAAYEALQAAGFARRDGDVTPLDHAMAHAKHLPVVISADTGIALELHTRIIHEVPPGDLTGTIGDTEALLARRISGDMGGLTVPYLDPTDTLLHLVVHAAHDHLFDNGPLVFNDLAMILQACPIDWPRFAAMARAGGWQRGASLLLQLTSRYHGPLGIPEDLFPEEVLTEEVLDAAAMLTLVDRRSAANTQFRAGLFGQALSGGLLAFVRDRALPHRHTLARFAGLPLESRRVWLHYPRWLWVRSQQRLLSDGGPGQQADRRHLVALQGWLDAG